MLPESSEGWSEARRLLDGRCAVPVTIVDAPRGHGRSELLRQAFAADPPVSGSLELLIVAGVGRLSSDVALAADIVRRLGGARSERPSILGSDDPVDVVVEAWRDALGRAPHVVVAVDEAHRAGPRALVMLGHLAAVLPPNAHLVVGGTGLHRLQVAEMEIEGRVQRIGPDLLELRDTQTSERREALRREALEKDVDEPVRRLISVLVSLGIVRVDRARIAAQALELDAGVVESLAALPGVALNQREVDIDDGWQFAGRGVDPSDLRTAGDAVGRALLRDARDLAEAVRLAEAVHDAGLFRQCVRRALSAQPPLVGAHTLRAWSSSSLLTADDPHRLWVEAAAAAAVGAPLADVFDLYARAGAAFAAADDVDAEIAVGMAASIVARRRDDLMAVVHFIGRAQALVAKGCDAARAPARFGDALAAQMSGDAQRALDILDQIAPGELSGDWAAQLFMMRGTNLLLLERLDQAVDALSAATGWGSAWSHAVALDLLAFTRWRQGDLAGALDDLHAAERIAGELGQTLAVERARCLRAVMLAASGESPDRAASRAADHGAERARLTSTAAEPETTRLVPIAAAFTAIASGDLDTARRIISAVDAPERALRSTSWTAALQVALDPSARARWRAVVEQHPGLGVAVRNGEAAAAYLEMGRPAPLEARGFVCVVMVRALPARGGDRPHRSRGGPPQRRARHAPELGSRPCPRALPVPRRRARHGTRARGRTPLARPPGPGGQPEPAGDAVLPARRDRSRTLARDRERPPRRPWGVLGFASNELVRIDLRRQEQECDALIAAHATGDRPGVIAAARRLVRHPEGRLLGGALVGSWVEPFESQRRLRCCGPCRSAHRRPATLPIPGSRCSSRSSA